MELDVVERNVMFRVVRIDPVFGFLPAEIAVFETLEEARECVYDNGFDTCIENDQGEMFEDYDMVCDAM